MKPDRHNRRSFFGRCGAVFGGLIGASHLPAVSASQDADLVVLNTKVYTVGLEMPSGTALAVQAGRFIAVGTNEEVQTFSGKHTETIDGRQMTVVPGFIDCHNHAPGSMLLYEVILGNPY